jgi:hypothetical protein
MQPGAAEAHSQKPPPREWTLRGQTDIESIARRQDILGTVLKAARGKGTEIAQLRQTNLNYAILVFAALFTFSFQFSKGWYSVAVSAALLFVMCLFSSLDRRFHKFIHGFRATERHLIDSMATLINQPSSDLTFRRYISEAQNTAERWSLQPVITYSLVVVSALHLFYCLWLALTK